jgi:hypothetical protein
MSWNWHIFTGTNTFEHAEFKSGEFPLRRPAVFSQTVILSSLISGQILSLFNDKDKWGIDEDTRLRNSKWLIPNINQSLHLIKRPFFLGHFHLSYVILSALDVNNISCLQLRLYLYKITRTLILSICMGYVSGLRNNSLHAIKMFIQRCKMVILCNGQHLNFQHIFWDVIREVYNLSLHLNYYISWCYSVR